MWKISLINSYLVLAFALLSLFYLLVLPTLFHVKRAQGLVARALQAMRNRLGKNELSVDPRDYDFVTKRSYIWLGWPNFLRNLLLITVAIVLVGTTTGLTINRPMRYVSNLEQLRQFAFPPAYDPITVTDIDRMGKITTSGPKLNALTYPPNNAAAQAAKWRSQMRQIAPRKWELRVKGAYSGEEDVIVFWVPPGYSPNNGKTYNVMEFLHGYPGSPFGVTNALDFENTLVKAQEDGTIPPTIAVIPEDNLRNRAPICADVKGGVQTSTWLSFDVPRITRTLFPNTTDQRKGWMLIGNSSGAFCAGRLGILYGDVFGEIAVLSGYDEPQLGPWRDPRHATFKQNTLSHLIDEKRPWPVRMYIYGASLDTDSAGLVRSISQAKKLNGDYYKFQVTARGGHNWDTWRIEMPNIYRWWGQELKAGQPDTLSTPARMEGAILSAQQAPFFSIMGWGNIGLFALLALALLVWCNGRVSALMKPLRYPLPGEIITTKRWLGSWARAFGWQTLTWLTCLFAVALVFNRAGEFFTSYDEIYQALAGLIEHVIVKIQTGKIVSGM